MIVIAGTGFSGEIKKSIFSVMNYLLPLEDNVLPMHCSAEHGSHQPRHGRVLWPFGHG